MEHLVPGSFFSFYYLSALLYYILWEGEHGGDDDFWDLVCYLPLRFEISWWCALGWVCSHPFLLEEHVASSLETYAFSSEKMSWILCFVLFFFYYVVFFLSETLLEHMLGLLDCLSNFIFSDFHLIFWLYCLGDLLSPVFSTSVEFFICAVTFPRFVLWIFKITSCSYFTVIILSIMFFSCNISFLQVVYFVFSLILKAFLRCLVSIGYLLAFNTGD